MFNEKEISLLILFFEYKYISKEFASKKLNISIRSFSRYINTLKSNLGKYHVDIQYDKVRGYFLNYKNKNEFNKFKRVIFYKSKNTINHKIIICLLEKNKWDIDCLSENLFYSDSFIINKFKEINILFKKYNLVINYKKRSNIELIGNEENIRKMLLSEFMIYQNNVLISTSLPNIDQEMFEKINKIVKQELLNSKVQFSYVDFSILLSHILISVYRSLKYSENTQYKEALYHKIIKNIIVKINDECKCRIGIAEIEYIYRNTFFGGNKNELDLKEKIKKLLDYSILLIEQVNPNYYNFTDKSKSALMTHIDFLLKRPNNDLLSNPILKEIKTEYLVELNDALIIAKQIKNTFDVEINEDELGYIAIHLGACRNKYLSLKKAIIICNYGIGTSEIVKNKIEDNFRNIAVIGVYPSVYLDLAISLKPDYIISTVKLDNYDLGIPVIDGSKILTKDKLEISFISDNLLYSFFNKDLFINLKAKSKSEILKKIVDILSNKSVVSKDDAKKIIEREELASTEIGNQIAFPHIIADENVKSTISIFKLDKAICWSKTKVKLVIVLIISSKDLDKLSYLKKFYKILNNKDSATKLLEANTYEKFITELENSKYE